MTMTDAASIFSRMANNAVVPDTHELYSRTAQWLNDYAGALESEPDEFTTGRCPYCGGDDLFNCSLQAGDPEGMTAPVFITYNSARGTGSAPVNTAKCCRNCGCVMPFADFVEED